MRHFLKHNKISKIFNKNTIKLSCSYCRIIAYVTGSHNQNIIQPITENMAAIVEIDPNATR